MSLKDLSPAALRVAMRGGTAEWGRRASTKEHVGYAERQDARGGHYLKCRCGCGQRAKFRAMFNGICMYEGCEMSVRRFIKTGRSRPR